MKYIKNDWINFVDGGELSTKYGIDVVRWGKVIHVCRDGKPLFFDNEQDRDAEIKKLNNKEMYPKNIKMTKTEAIRAMLDGKKVFMTLWRNEPNKYIFFNGSEFKNSNGSTFENINTMSGDFRVVVNS